MLCTFQFSDGKIADTVEVAANILIDYGEQAEIVGIEIIDASTLMKANPLQEIIVNYHNLKDVACDYAKSRVAFGRLTPDLRGLDAS